MQINERVIDQVYVQCIKSFQYSASDFSSFLKLINVILKTKIV